MDDARLRPGQPALAALAALPEVEAADVLGEDSFFAPVLPPSVEEPDVAVVDEDDAVSLADELLRLSVR